MSPRVRNTSAAQAPPPQPLKQDGTPYAYELVHGWWRSYSDDPAELVADLIQGYTGELEQRVRYATEAEVRLQARLAIAGDLDACTPEEQAVILGDRAEPPVLERWTAPVPLVLVTAHYQPAGPRPRPEGEIVWLDPANDLSLLRSLHQAGVVRVSRSA